jgi:hypothetical protein
VGIVLQDFFQILEELSLEFNERISGAFVVILNYRAARLLLLLAREQFVFNFFVLSTPK